ncbi:hypothetical protein D4764_05G0011560 [Takifugu flavidus]|uniref:PiggyBac transposable element-derived protein domain-containing protein n=1 Tax=Takifugu flavidus TaxID=433684 RepID=A0A5C6N1I6_9TELE|nr:hypothetical protein D4764_05G0011560 [Takifugu flavidus]
MIVKMLQKGLDQEDEDGIGPESEISDDDNDPAYVPQGAAQDLHLDKFISDNIIEEVLRCTNLEGRRAVAAKGKEWKSIDKEDFLAFIGLTLLAGGDKSWDVALRELFLNPLQNPIYKATMGVGRYENIRRFIRFDNRRTRALRLETDHMTAFRYVWERFLDNCRRRFIPSDCVTIDEQLVFPVHQACV